MTRYELKTHYEDETSEVTTVYANSITEAVDTARRDPEVTSVTVLCAIDDRPQAHLASY